MKKMLRDAFILLVITLVAGLCLGFVYEVTKGPIAAQKEKAKTEAYLEVFQEAASFEADPDFSSDQIQNALNEAGLTEVSVQEVMLALDQNKTMLGYVVTVVSHEGYSGDITFSVGVKNDSTVNGISILSISETAGLGMKANTEEFKSQFAGVNTSKFEYTKSGASADNQIDAISGATITTNAITNGVNAALEYCNLMIQGGGQDE